MSKAKREVWVVERKGVGEWSPECPHFSESGALACIGVSPFKRVVRYVPAPSPRKRREEAMRTAEAILTAITGETDLSAHWKIRKAITAAQREAFAAGVEAAAAFVAHGEYTGEPVTQADAEDLAARIRSIKFPEDVK